MAIRRDKLFLQVGQKGEPAIVAAIKSANQQGDELTKEDFIYLDAIDGDIRDVVVVVNNPYAVENMALDLGVSEFKVRAWFSREIQTERIEIDRYVKGERKYITQDGERVYLDSLYQQQRIALARNIWPGFNKYLSSEGYTAAELRSILGRKSIAQLEPLLELGPGVKKARYIEALKAMQKEDLAYAYDSITPISRANIEKLDKEFMEFFSFIADTYLDEEVVYEDRPIVMLPPSVYAGTTLFGLQGSERRIALAALALTGKLNQKVTKRGDAYTRPPRGAEIDPSQLDGDEPTEEPQGAFSVRDGDLSSALDMLEGYLDQDSSSVSDTGRTYLDNFWARASLTYRYDPDMENDYWFLDFDYYENYGEVA